MLAQTLLFLQLAVAQDGASRVYHGRIPRLDVAVRRVDTTATIDGALSESVWSVASLLTGFSQFSPVDARAATDSTEVLVWYSPTAIYFGIRAFAPAGTVNATLAERDKIQAEDNVQILLSTFNDRRQALVFAVNPLGVQADGSITEGQGTSGGGTLGSQGSPRDPADLSANYVFESKGRLTEYGYEVEVRIPFKSLRYQAKDAQDWGLHVVRQVQRLGAEDSWAPARRGAASFLAQSGQLKGLQGMTRGIVFETIPSVVYKSGRDCATGTCADVRDGPDYGLNLKYGVTNNLVLNGTVNPDFSQVEADVGALQFDPRSAVFFPERRPFFLEGISNFQVQNNLIYTRRIAQPDVAVKLTGKALGTNLALLSAMDDKRQSRALEPNERPRYNVLRLSRDLGSQSRMGLVYTDRMDGSDYNRVAGLDGRLVFKELYSAAFQYAHSWTQLRGTAFNAPIWNLTAQRRGRRLTMTYRLNGIDSAFRADAGFIGRRGIVGGRFDQFVSLFGSKDAFIQSFTSGVALDGTWVYDAFLDGRAAQDRKLHFNENFLFKGGWSAGMSLFLESFGYDPGLYRNYYVERRTAARVDTIPFTGTPRLYNVDWVFRLDTPEFERFSANLFYIFGRDENFFEWATADIAIGTAQVTWRPTDQLRLDAQYQHQEYNRRDHTTVGLRRIPRLKAEYQATRSIFVRVVGQYDSDWHDDLRDDTRTNGALLFRQADGAYVRLTSQSNNALRVDWLFSWQPTPGTVFFAGYGATDVGAAPMRLRDLTRRDDGIFVKLSYLYQL
ncbi:MAG TPA: DUF5916 domain-containing protein [Gemmatimonadaceae bacterium]|nr:DUF5916 domain-containing protein [Gemmatimonadaceae bacterium]